MVGIMPQLLHSPKAVQRSHVDISHEVQRSHVDISHEVQRSHVDISHEVQRSHVDISHEVRWALGNSLCCNSVAGHGSEKTINSACRSAAGCIVTLGLDAYRTLATMSPFVTSTI